MPQREPFERVFREAGEKNGAVVFQRWSFFYSIVLLSGGLICLALGYAFLFAAGNQTSDRFGVVYYLGGAAIFFIGLAIAKAWSSLRVVVDPEEMIVTRITRRPLSRRVERMNFGDIRCVTLREVILNKKKRYRVQIAQENGRAFSLGTDSSPGRARKLADRLSDLLNVPLED